MNSGVPLDAAGVPPLAWRELIGPRRSAGVSAGPPKAGDDVGRYRLGIDIGGTFTDFSLLDELTGELASFKSPTVAGDPGRGVLDGVRALVAERGLDPGAIDYLVHGTTIAINTVIQRNGAALGLLVTAGFGDLLEIQRLRLASPVNFTATRPTPLIPRYRVGEVTERILTDGTVDTTLDREQLLREATRLVEREGSEALVVSFINAYRTPAHEVEARKVLAEQFPDLHVTCSHEVWPQIREYERTMVAVLSAYVRPRVDRYLAHLERELGRAGVRVPFHITKSNGGVTSAGDGRNDALRAGVRGHGGGRGLRGGRVSEPRHLRHGRHQRRHRARARWPARVFERRDGGRVPDRDAGGRRLLHRSGRGLDRVAG